MSDEMERDWVESSRVGDSKWKITREGGLSTSWAVYFGCDIYETLEYFKNRYIDIIESALFIFLLFCEMRLIVYFIPNYVEDM